MNDKYGFNKWDVESLTLTERCALCGEPIDGAFQYVRGADGVRILHDEKRMDPSCWELWAVYGHRPVKRFYPWPNEAR
jgi:hypothetical protein